MDTWQSFQSPLTCSMQAFIESEGAKERTYVCVSRDRAVALLGGNISGLTQAQQVPQTAK